MDKEFPSPIIMKHPSGIVKELNRTTTTIFGAIFGCIYFAIIGLWSFVARYLLVNLMLIISISIIPKNNNILGATAVVCWFVYLVYFLPKQAYDERCTHLYNQGFRDFDYYGNPIER